MGRSPSCCPQPRTVPPNTPTAQRTAGRVYRPKERLYPHDYTDAITIEPGKRDGKPCIKGMRITVDDILEYPASGMYEARVLDDFPYSESAVRKKRSD